MRRGTQESSGVAVVSASRRTSDVVSNIGWSYDDHGRQFQNVTPLRRYALP